MSAKGYVYFIAEGKSAIKIGFTRSKDITKRLKQLSTGNSKNLEILWYCEGNMELERTFQNLYFKQYNIKNEWFQYEPIKRWIERKKLELEIQKELGYIK